MTQVGPRHLLLLVLSLGGDDGVVVVELGLRMAVGVGTSVPGLMTRDTRLMITIMRKKSRPWTYQMLYIIMS